MFVKQTANVLQHLLAKSRIRSIISDPFCLLPVIIQLVLHYKRIQTYVCIGLDLVSAASSVAINPPFM